ncbi:MAG: DHHA1 domain-containing protein, partial [Phycisphaerales bacterium]
IVRHGLSQLPHCRNEGLRALITASGLDSEKIDTDAVGFRLAPRLNAIGRLGHARDALELMTEATGPRAMQLAEQLSRVNEDRKARELAILTQANEMAQDQGMTAPGSRAIVLAHEDWHPGIVGIVCSKLVDRYARPTILMQKTPQGCKGSGRSIECFHLHAGLGACAEHLMSFGGHDMAAGMQCAPERFETFRDAFIQHANDRLCDDDLVHHTRYDCSARLEELTATAVRQLDRLAPFGAGNGRVRIRLTGIKLNGSCDPFGKTGNHLSLRIGSAGGNGPAVRVVGWGWARHAAGIPNGAPVEMIVEPVLSTWKGNTRIEPVLVDLRVL